MKKILLATVIALVTATSAHAACDGGTESNGFCSSNIELNWWSAANWCKANGRHLATIYEVCPRWDGDTGSGKCLMVASYISGSAWTATAWGSDYAFTVASINAGVYNNALRHGTHRALCK